MKQKTDLRRLVEQAQGDARVWPIIVRQAAGILASLGMDYRDARILLTEHCFGKSISDLAAFEYSLHLMINTGNQWSQRLAFNMRKRAIATFDTVFPYLTVGLSVVDVGCGSGEISVMLNDKVGPTTCVDVMDWRGVAKELPFLRVKHNRVEAELRQFSQAVVLTVFHHTDDPEALVKEVFRVANRVIIIESVTNTPLEFSVGCWIDWFYNRVIHYVVEENKKINVPCNFLPATAWEQLIWKLTGRTPTHSVDLGVFQELNPEHHHLLAYE